MRRVTIVLGIVVVAGVIAFVIISNPGLLDQIGIGGSAGVLRGMTNSFLEDIQFKDFKKAASYHAPEERATVDIPFLLERLFFVKPEQLDIMGWEILFSRVDSTGLRGRVKSRVKVKDLLRNQLHERELVLYYYRNSRNDPWRMRLETSLRELEAEKDKKH
ncbi:MAG: hypothetical protein AB1714_24885 [Acidobacteriota bacterium]